MEQITDRLNRFMQLHDTKTESSQDHTKTTTQHQLERHSISQSNPDNNDTNQFLRPDIVEISPAGKSKAEHEEEARSLARSLHKLATEAPSETQEKKSSDPIDQAIEETKKLIRELKERMDQLKDNNDEASEKLLDELDKQMLALNAQLMALSQKKLELLKKP